MKKELKVSISGLRSMCRVCLTTNGRLANVFCGSLSLKSTIAVALMECASVKIVRGDGASPLICSKCYGKLKEVHQFRAQCKRADAIIHNYVQQLNVSNLNKQEEKNNVHHLTKQNRVSADPLKLVKRSKKGNSPKKEMNLQVTLDKSDCHKNFNVSSTAVCSPMFQNNNSQNNLFPAASQPTTTDYCDTNGLQSQKVPTTVDSGMTNETQSTVYSSPTTVYGVAPSYEPPVQTDYMQLNANNFNYNSRNPYPSNPDSNTKPIHFQQNRTVEENNKPEIKMEYVKAEQYQLANSENEEYLDESVERILNGIIRCSDSQADHSEPLYPQAEPETANNVPKNSDGVAYAGADLQTSYLNKGSGVPYAGVDGSMFPYTGPVPYNGQEYGGYPRTPQYDQRTDYHPQYNSTTYGNSQQYLGENYGNNFQQYTPNNQQQYIDYNADNSNYSFDNATAGQYVPSGEYSPYSGTSNYVSNGPENSSWLPGQFDNAVQRNTDGNNVEEKRDDGDEVKKKRPRATVKRPRKRQEDAAETTESGNQEERPFVCDVCNKTFKHSSNLLQHKKIHSGIRVECDVCKKYFSRKTTLKIHYQKFHSGPEVATPAE